jgi:hypothetical protein
VLGAFIIGAQEGANPVRPGVSFFEPTGKRFTATIDIRSMNQDIESIVERLPRDGMSCIVRPRGQS